ncbi:hypothetical protein [Gordonia humi]|uniref:Uncharacterized protein n=1 Tax=Gordonia humi TaxID=686429 RepID=A0A840F440_9ACTN|nr:hypothetical protein [Gordonia humi]MBB4137263.1 hypothetical protein [Gordonia humi]
MPDPNSSSDAELTRTWTQLPSDLPPLPDNPYADYFDNRPAPFATSSGDPDDDR